MIHIDLKPEPADFDECVRAPGNSFLGRCPNPKKNDWDRHRYWTRCSDQLYQAMEEYVHIVDSGSLKQHLPFRLITFIPKAIIRKRLMNGIIIGSQLKL